MKKWLIILISFIVIILFVFMVGIQVLIRIGAFGAFRKGIVVRVEQAQRGELIEFVSAPGEIEPKTKVELSAKVMARIVALPY